MGSFLLLPLEQIVSRYSASYVEYNLNKFGIALEKHYYSKPDIEFVYTISCITYHVQPTVSLLFSSSGFSSNSKYP